MRVHVKSENTSYTEEHIQSHYTYEKNHVQVFGHGSEVRVIQHLFASVSNTDLLCCALQVIITPKQHHFQFRTKRKVPRVGTLLVGLGGNNGSTVRVALALSRFRALCPTHAFAIGYSNR